MTRVRALDSNHDWLFGSGKSDYLINNMAVAQNINTRLNSFVGNCFFDLTAGINWFNLLGTSKGKAGQTALNLAISTVILNTPQVTGLRQLSSSLDVNRNFSVFYQAQTVYSLVTSNFVFSSSIG
jgi:hypothetical protein